MNKLEKVKAYLLVEIGELAPLDQLAAWEEKEKELKDHLFWTNSKLWDLHVTFEKPYNDLAARERISGLISDLEKLERRDTKLIRFVKTQKEGLAETLRGI